VRCFVVLLWALCCSSCALSRRLKDGSLCHPDDLVFKPVMRDRAAA